MKKVLLTGALKYSAAQLEQIEALGFDITQVGDERIKLDIDVSGINAVVCNGLFLTNNIEVFGSLEFIQLTSAGLDRVPLEYIHNAGIRLCNAKGVYSVPIAEFAVLGILSLYKDFKRLCKNQENSVWDKSRTLTEIYGKNVCIVGMGSIGTEIAIRMKAFGCNISGITSRKSIYADKVYAFDDIESAVSQADIVIISVPLAANTVHLFSRELIGKMKDKAVLVNIARGGIVDEAALTCALKQGKLSGAVLDVFECEPLPAESPLWKMDNVVLTPHNSFVSDKNNARLFELIINNLREYISEK